MTVSRILLAALLALPLSVGLADAAPSKSARKPGAQPPAKQRVCTAVDAVATGFGQDNVIDFANRNLALALNGAKDKLASQGAKGFKVEEQRVSCEDYIDFGGSIGREHKCRATAKLCGLKT